MVSCCPSQTLLAALRAWPLKPGSMGGKSWTLASPHSPQTEFWPTFSHRTLCQATAQTAKRIFHTVVFIRHIRECLPIITGSNLCPVTSAPLKPQLFRMVSPLGFKPYTGILSRTRSFSSASNLMNNHKKNIGGHLPRGRAGTALAKSEPPSFPFLFHARLLGCSS